MQQQTSVFVQGLSIKKAIQVVFLVPAQGISGQQILATLSALPELQQIWPKLGGVPNPQRFLRGMMGKSYLDGNTLYKLEKDVTIQIDLRYSDYQLEKLNAEGINQRLVNLAPGSWFKIGCYLHSAPGDPDAMRQQQFLNRILDALDHATPLKVLLIDLGFAKSLEGQVVAYLVQQKNVQVAETLSPDSIVREYQVISYKGSSMNAMIQIIYVSLNANDQTIDAMNANGGKGGWYTLNI
jgi:hypothetical protein